MINCYTNEEMMTASKVANELAASELKKAGLGFLVAGAAFVYGLVKSMNFGFLKANSETYRKIGVDSLNIM